jgi:hypothetical protein
VSGGDDAAPVEVQLAIGRLLRMMSRPERPGDLDDYHACRSIILDASPVPVEDYRPNYARDRRRGAAGQ